MADFPQTPVLPLFISSFTRYCNWCENPAGTSPGTSLTWAVANKAIYIPFAIPWPYPVRRVFWQNGSSVTTTNRDFGIYSASSGTQIYHTGSTAAAGASVMQYITSTEFMLAPGRYYMAIATDSTVAARGGMGASALNAAKSAMAGFLEQTSSLPLPATMTPATVTIQTLPLCGFTLTSTGF